MGWDPFHDPWLWGLGGAFVLGLVAAGFSPLGGLVVVPPWLVPLVAGLFFSAGFFCLVAGASCFGRLTHWLALGGVVGGVLICALLVSPE